MTRRIASGCLSPLHDPDQVAGDLGQHALALQPFRGLVGADRVIEGELVVGQRRGEPATPLAFGSRLPGQLN
jgi:hypothetical protein